MKTTSGNAFVQVLTLFVAPWIVRVALLAILSLPVRELQAQAPSILWTTNLGATLFAVDAQTNAYANVGGTVIKINGAGVPVQTNSICPLPGIAQRDSSGNYYFAGVFSGTQDFGGVVLSVQFNSICYLAKYSPAGSLLWATNYGPNDINIYVTDLALDEARNAYVGHRFKMNSISSTSYLARVASNGSVVWDMSFPYISWSPGATAVKVTPESTTSCIAFRHYFVGSVGFYNSIFRVDDLGGCVLLDTTTLTASAWSEASRPVLDGSGNIYCVNAGKGNLDVTLLNGQSGSAIWASPAGTNATWTLGRDWLGGVYVGHNSDGGSGVVLNRLARYDSDGHCLWTMTNLTSLCLAAISDLHVNLFASFADGTLWRIAAEPAQPPVITDPPAGKTVLAGSTTSLSVGCSGSSPFTYIWCLNGNNLPAASKATLTMSNVNPAQMGVYTVIISNAANSVTSAPALLRVKQVAVFEGNQLLTNGTYTFATPPILNVQSSYTGGALFYTLDGSAPSFSSTPYAGPFAVSHSATVRALGYSSDFQQSEEADTVNIVVLENHTLTTLASGGGSVALDPPGGNYLSTNSVTTTAVPDPGWTFLYWLGDASQGNPVVSLTMERDKSVRAVFGTTLSTTVAGSGAVQLTPPGGLYPFGTKVRLTGVPDPGNYFGFWGNAATGNTNPLYFTITAPTQTLSSIFGATPGGQAALTVLIEGSGRVSVNPRASAYTLNQAVTLTATPDAGQSFLGWSGDASGTQNPLLLTLTAAKTVTANFTKRPTLRVDPPGLNGYTVGGFRFSLTGEPPGVYQIYGSTDLTNWSSLGSVTNVYGEVQFTEGYTTNAPQKFYRAVP